MNKLVITQDNSRTEYPVPNAVITALYNIGKDDDQNLSLTEGVDTTNNNRPVSTVSGSIRVATAYAHHLLYIAVKYPNLSITADSTYIYFADPEVERVLLAAGIGDGVGISISAAANATIGTALRENTTITSFNEFGYFTKANDNPSGNMFEGCSSLGLIDLSNITKLGDRQFFGTGITTVNMPNLLTLSGNELFCGCSNLTSVQNLGTITSFSYTTFANCTNLESVILPATITTLTNTFNGCSKLKTINLQNISVIGNNGLRETLLTDVNINDLLNLVSIGEYAFLLTRISGILNLPKLTTIESLAFDRCSLITGIECLGKLSTISNSRVFYGTGVTYVKIPYECTNIGNSAFENCSNLTSIKQYTDSIDNWVEGVEPTTGPLSRVTSFGLSCFEGCSLLLLTQQDIQNAITIGSEAFENTLLSGDIVLPQLSTIGTYAFERTRITSIDLTGSSISRLPKGVFSQCSSLSKISIPTSVTRLDEYWCDGIANVLTLEGFDNCVSHGLNNWQLYNKTILNPIKTSFVSDSSAIMYLYSDDTDINYNLLYNPSLTSTNPGRRLYNAEYYTYFVGRPGGGPSRVNIGLLYFRDISSFGALTFFKCNIDNLVINNVTPPTLNYSTEASRRYYNTQVWDNNIFPTGNSDQNDNVVIGTLWVPDSAVATYQADPLYSHLNIKGINTKTNGTDYDLPRYATYAAWKAAEEAAAAQGGHAVTGIIEEYM